MGLRSLYFVLADMLNRFEHLRYSLIAILLFIGIKMVLIPLKVHIPIGLSLGVIGLFMVAGVAFSLYREKKNDQTGESS
jgi:tellurite resistance protein TerC